MTLRTVAALTIGALSLATPALADPISFDVFGHAFEIRGEPFQEELWLDGAKVHENGFLVLDSIGIVGDTLVIVGLSATGGNMCGAAPFVVSYPAGGAPVFDGPVDTCVQLTATLEPNDILFRGTPTPLAPGEQWSWHPGAGFVMEAPVPFVPKTESGFAAAAAGAIDHPFRLFEYGDVLALSEPMMGGERDEILTTFSGPGTGELRGTLYVGDACFPHNCPYAQAFVAADTTTDALYMAWNLSGRVTVVPSAAEWPQAAAAALAAWRMQNGL